MKGSRKQRNEFSLVWKGHEQASWFGLARYFFNVEVHRPDLQFQFFSLLITVDSEIGARWSEGHRAYVWHETNKQTKKSGLIETFNDWESWTNLIVNLPALDHLIFTSNGQLNGYKKKAQNLFAQIHLSTQAQNFAHILENVPHTWRVIWYHANNWKFHNLTLKASGRTK